MFIIVNNITDNVIFKDLTDSIRSILRTISTRTLVSLLVYLYRSIPLNKQLFDTQLYHQMEFSESQLSLELLRTELQRG